MIAYLYDIHGNLPALEAVLEDARDRGVDRFVLGGDYFSLGGWPIETVELLKTLDAPVWIRGNWERFSADVENAIATELGGANELLDNWLRGIGSVLGGEIVEQLAALPESVVFNGALVCHASPLSDVRSFSLEPAADDGELLDGVEQRRVIFGHTHLQFQRRTGLGVELINPGSVGLPFDGDPRAAYAIIDSNDEVQLLRVSYDYEATASRMEASYTDKALGRAMAWTVRAGKTSSEITEQH